MPPKTQAIVTEDMKVWEILGVWEMDSSGENVSRSRLAFVVFPGITILSSNTLNFFMDLSDNVRIYSESHLGHPAQESQTHTDLHSFESIVGCCMLVSSRNVELQQGGNWWLTKIRVSTGLVDLYGSITRKPYTQLCPSRKRIDALLPRQHKQRSLETRFAAGDTMTVGTKLDISISKLHMKDYIIIIIYYIYPTCI